MTAQFPGRIELSRKVEIRRGSLIIALTLVTVGRVIIEYGALMQGLRELARLLPDRIREVLGKSSLLGPPALTIALSAGGGAALIVVGVLLGHFL